MLPVDHFRGIALDSNQISVILELGLDKVDVMSERLIYGELYWTGAVQSCLLKISETVQQLMKSFPATLYAFVGTRAVGLPSNQPSSSEKSQSTLVLLCRSLDIDLMLLPAQ